MTTARIFQHRGSQAVRLPKACRFLGSEVLIETQGDAVILRPVARCQFESFADIAQYLAEKFPHATEASEVAPVMPYE